MATARAVLAQARAALAAAGAASPGLDARLLLAGAAGLSTARLIADDGEALPAVAQARFDAYLRRRLAGEPVARILGEREFWGLRFAIGPATLEPRPDTETLVETALGYARSRGEGLRICDLGTGTGAILIALLHELPAARGVAIDISAAALEVARENAERLGVAARTAFRCADFAAPLEGRFDLIVSNPPYVRRDAIAALAPEVRGFDPHLALDGGPDGLAAYRAILARAPSALSDGGMLALEVGYEGGAAVAGMCRAAGLDPVVVTPDLAGVPRVVSGLRASGPGPL